MTPPRPRFRAGTISSVSTVTDPVSAGTFIRLPQFASFTMANALSLSQPVQSMEPRIEILAAKKLIGQRMTTTLSHNRTGELWRSFMPRRREIINSIGTDLYSLQVFPPFYFTPFSPDTEFEKWAAVEVASFDHLPHGMETLILPAGTYAVFLHRGPASSGPATFRYIYTEWLPRSGYLLANRPHFEVLGERYKNEDPLSEEEVWIPVEREEVRREK